MINLTAKLGEISDIEHNKGSKIDPQNQVVLDCIMPTIPLKHKCFKYHSDMGHCFSYGPVVVKKNFFFFFFDWDKQDMVLGKRWLFSIGNGAEIRPLQKGIKCPGITYLSDCKRVLLLPFSFSMTILRRKQNKISIICYLPYEMPIPHL